MCHCGLQAPYESCCGRLHNGEKAASAEALMRSRYCAFVVENIDYLEQTLHPNERDDFDPKSSLQWSRSAEWLGLEILRTENGLEEDLEGVVEYIARYKIKQKTLSHHEIGRFVQENGQWYYLEGDMVGQTVKRDAKKIGRNKPCPCGSGKKYKKCCGR